MRRKSPGNCSHSLWLQICSKPLKTTVSVQVHHGMIASQKYLFILPPCKDNFFHFWLHDFTLRCLTFENLLTMGPAKYNVVDFTKQLAGVWGVNRCVVKVSQKRLIFVCFYVLSIPQCGTSYLTNTQKVYQICEVPVVVKKSNMMLHLIRINQWKQRME